MMNLLFCFTFGIILITLGFALKKPLQKLDYKKPFVRAWRLVVFNYHGNWMYTARDYSVCIGRYRQLTFVYKGYLIGTVL